MAEISAEDIVIAGLCQSKVNRDKYLAEASVEDFLTRGNAVVFEAIVNLAEAGHAITKDTLPPAIQDPTNRMLALFYFDNKVPHEITAAVWEAFKRGGQRARLIKIRDYLAKSLNKAADTDTVLEELRAMLTQAGDTSTAIEVSSPEETAAATHEFLEQLAAEQQPVISGLPELDDNLFMNQFIGYTVLAGMSGMGKTAFMATIAKNNARRGVPVTICSLEMRRELLWIRMAMDQPGMKGHRLNAQTIQDSAKLSRIKYAVDQLKQLPIYITQGVYNIFRLDQIARRYAIEKGSRLVLFDYIQLGRSKPTDSDVQRVYTVSRILQGLTKPDLPTGYRGQEVIALSQYNNESTKEVPNFPKDGQLSGPQRKAIRFPGNADLAWSGQIKQDADTILHLRPMSDPDNLIVDVDVFCGKQRNDSMGWSIRTEFRKHEQVFVTRRSLKK